MNKYLFSDRVFVAVRTIVLIFVGSICVLPILHVFAISFSDFHSISSGSVGILPVNFNFNAYNTFFRQSNVVGAFANSVVITIVGVALSMVFTILAAYPLSKKYFIGRSFFIKMVIFTMVFSGGIIPTYLLVNSLGLVDSYFSLWLPGLISTYNVLILRSSFESLSNEIDDAARIDGCCEYRLLFSIYIPLSLAILATLSLFYAVAFWNMFMNILMYINTSEKYNLAVMVQQLIQSQSALQDMENIGTNDTTSLTPQGITSAGVVIMILPMMAVYPFLQKYFVKGVMLGAVKG